MFRDTMYSLLRDFDADSDASARILLCRCLAAELLPYLLSEVLPLGSTASALIAPLSRVTGLLATAATNSLFFNNANATPTTATDDLSATIAFGELKALLAAAHTLPAALHDRVILLRTSVLLTEVNEGGGFGGTVGNVVSAGFGGTLGSPVRPGGPLSVLGSPLRIGAAPPQPRLASCNALRRWLVVLTRARIHLENQGGSDGMIMEEDDQGWANLTGDFSLTNNNENEEGKDGVLVSHLPPVGALDLDAFFVLFAAFTAPVRARVRKDQNTSGGSVDWLFSSAEHLLSSASLAHAALASPKTFLGSGNVGDGMLPPPIIAGAFGALKSAVQMQLTAQTTTPSSFIILSRLGVLSAPAWAKWTSGVGGGALREALAVSAKTLLSQGGGERGGGGDSMALANLWRTCAATAAAAAVAESAFAATNAPIAALATRLLTAALVAVGGCAALAAARDTDVAAVVGEGGDFSFLNHVATAAGHAAAAAVTPQLGKALFAPLPTNIAGMGGETMVSPITAALAARPGAAASHLTTQGAVVVAAGLAACAARAAAAAYLSALPAAFANALDLLAVASPTTQHLPPSASALVSGAATGAQALLRARRAGGSAALSAALNDVLAIAGHSSSSSSSTLPIESIVPLPIPVLAPLAAVAVVEGVKRVARIVAPPTTVAISLTDDTDDDDDDNDEEVAVVSSTHALAPTAAAAVRTIIPRRLSIDLDDELIPSLPLNTQHTLVDLASSITSSLSASGGGPLSASLRMSVTPVMHTTRDDDDDHDDGGDVAAYAANIILAPLPTSAPQPPPSRVAQQQTLPPPPLTPSLTSLRRAFSPASPRGAVIRPAASVAGVMGGVSSGRGNTTETIMPMIKTAAATVDSVLEFVPLPPIRGDSFGAVGATVVTQTVVPLRAPSSSTVPLPLPSIKPSQDITTMAPTTMATMTATTTTTTTTTTTSRAFPAPVLAALRAELDASIDDLLLMPTDSLDREPALERLRDLRLAVRAAESLVARERGQSLARADLDHYFAPSASIAMAPQPVLPLPPPPPPRARSPRRSTAIAGPTVNAVRAAAAAAAVASSTPDSPLTSQLLPPGRAHTSPIGHRLHATSLSATPPRRGQLSPLLQGDGKVSGKPHTRGGAPRQSSISVSFVAPGARGRAAEAKVTARTRARSTVRPGAGFGGASRFGVSAAPPPPPAVSTSAPLRSRSRSQVRAKSQGPPLAAAAAAAEHSETTRPQLSSTTTKMTSARTGRSVSRSIALSMVAKVSAPVVDVITARRPRSVSAKRLGELAAPRTRNTAALVIAAAAAAESVAPPPIPAPPVRKASSVAVRSPPSSMEKKTYARPIPLLVTTTTSTAQSVPVMLEFRRTNLHAPLSPPRLPAPSFLPIPPPMTPASPMLSHLISPPPPPPLRAASSTIGRTPLRALFASGRVAAEKLLPLPLPLPLRA